MPRGRGGTRAGEVEDLWMEGLLPVRSMGKIWIEGTTPYAIDGEDMDRRPTPNAIDEETDVYVAAHDPSNINRLPNPSVYESSSIHICPELGSSGALFGQWS
ncbi:hypothetical protein Dimus_037120, partial [Dionaea muscipula]